MRVGLYTRIAEDIAGEGLVSRARTGLPIRGRAVSDQVVDGPAMTVEDHLPCLVIGERPGH